MSAHLSGCKVSECPEGEDGAQTAQNAEADCAADEGEEGSTGGGGSSSDATSSSSSGAGGTVSPPEPDTIADQAFEETGADGEWRVDNSRVHEGEFAAHPPELSDRGSASMTFDCGGEPHSRLTFWYVGWAPEEGQELRLYVDDVLYTTYGQTSYTGSGYAWREVSLIVPTGEHEYRWEATTDLEGQPPYWVDSIRCLDTPVEDNDNGRFDFEQGFVAPEIGGDFVIDNSLVQDGSFAAHPPLLEDSGTAKLDFACGGESHSQLTFWYVGWAPEEGQELRLYVDDVLYTTYGQTSYTGSGYAWREVSLIVPTGEHEYRWEATTDLEGQPPYWVDSIRCLDTPVEDNDNGRFDFEQGFVAPEIGGDFVIDNSLVQDGSFAAHPPLLEDSGTAKLDFACGGESHSQLTFWYVGWAPEEGQELRLYVDDVLYTTYGQTSYTGSGYAWREVSLIVPTGEHEYRWEVTTDLEGRPPYAVDSIRCLDTPVEDNDNGRFDFEQGFVAPEIGGDFVIDNSLVQDGSFAAHPPLLEDSGTAKLDFACGGESHSQLTFWYVGWAPEEGQELRFLVDGDPYETYTQTAYTGSGYRWEEVTVVVGAGEHEYEWVATTELPGQPPFWLDSIRCE